MSGYNNYDPEMLEEPPSTCNRIVCGVWKTVTFVLSHITLVTLVVSYCIGGAKMFESLESHHERAVKANISRIRKNITDHLWNLTNNDLLPVLEKNNYTNTTILYLKDFETALLYAMTKGGWDGNESTNETQWTFEGALFYSIIVITTIGYGHIAPKTDWGKVATIFYAIIGIPLMLLCLSNVGDILATSFRFLYWRVCCYVCTKKPKRRSRSRTISKGSGGRHSRSRTASFRRSVRTSTRSADSGFGMSEIIQSSHSDTDLTRYNRDEYSRTPKMRPSQQSRFSDTLPNYNRRQPLYNRMPKGGSLDRKHARYLETSLEQSDLDNTPVLCNRYVLNQHEEVVNHNPDASRNVPTQGRRAISMPRTQQHYSDPIADEQISDPPRQVNRRRRRSPPPYSSSPKIMSPMGFGKRQRYLDESESELDYYEDEYSDAEHARDKPVPIWLCVLLVLSYIIAGMFLFNYWESWDHLDAAYFCFITLTTIGFGDFVPTSTNPKKNAKVSIALCSLYLLFGISLLAMSFNLVQEEVLTHVRRLAKSLGIIKEDENEEDEDN